MTRKLVFISLALAVAATATPALAKSKKHHAHHPAPYYAGPYGYAPYPAAPFVSRNVSDPSFGNRAGLNYARSTGRCVEDLGYGRWEYCGW
jgi:hypothetical protein